MDLKYDTGANIQSHKRVKPIYKKEMKSRKEKKITTWVYQVSLIVMGHQEEEEKINKRRW
jgi:hemerythrin superfamily protein